MIRPCRGRAALGEQYPKSTGCFLNPEVGGTTEPKVAQRTLGIRA
jgi:hypothetical protein